MHHYVRVGSSLVSRLSKSQVVGGKNPSCFISKVKSLKVVSHLGVSLFAQAWSLQSGGISRVVEDSERPRALGTPHSVILSWHRPASRTAQDFVTWSHGPEAQDFVTWRRSKLKGLVGWNTQYVDSLVGKKIEKVHIISFNFCESLFFPWTLEPGKPTP
jgi:hypothetical protein